MGENGACVFIRGGNNVGRVGVLQHIEVHSGSYNIAHVKDANNNSFATRQDNCVIVGSSSAKPRPSLRSVTRDSVRSLSPRTKRRPPKTTTNEVTLFELTPPQVIQGDTTCMC